MRRSLAPIAFAAALTLALALGASPAAAAPQVNLTVTPASISFADANPDLVPSIVSSPTPVQVLVRVIGNGGAPWSLTVAVSDDLRSGADVITINNVTWTSSLGSPWQASGALALATPQTVAGGIGNYNPGQPSNLTFALANLWTSAPGNYTTTATFTLTAP